MNKPAGNFREDRHPSESYEDIIALDARTPGYLREGRVPDTGVAPVAAWRYYDPAFFRKEADHVWSKVWQWACREEDIPNVGDCEIYDILDKSLIVARTAPDTIKAFYNSCLHRGRKLLTLGGSKHEFKCPYHGFAWHCDGRFKENPIAWDFPQLRAEDLRLPEVRVDCWGGFVFVNFDAGARPLLEHIAPLADHFARYDWPNRYKAAHVRKTVRCNWKVCAEAFMESHHSVATHPQILPGLGDANSQYDLPNDWVSRHFSAGGVSSPFLPQRLSEKEIVAYMTGQASGGRRGNLGVTDVNLPPGMTARRYVADLTRTSLAAETGQDYSLASDAEMLDALLYNIFPNASFWAGYPTNLVYRWRPNGLDPESAIMDVLLLKPIPRGATERPRPAPAHVLGIDDPWSDASELGGLAVIFGQDMGNLPYVQEGLHASGTGKVHFAKYSEMRIRHLHNMIDRYIAGGEAATVPV